MDKNTDIQKKGDSVTEERPVAYFYDDKQLRQSFPVYDAREGTWWMDRTKVELLLERFKYHNTTQQASYLAGISYDQFRHFAATHKWVYPLIRIYRSVPAIRLKDIVLQEALGGKETPCGKCVGKGKYEDGRTCSACNGLGTKKSQPNAKLALGALRYFDTKEDDPEASGEPVFGSIPIGGGAVRTVNEAILDETGRILVSRQTAEILRKMKEDGTGGD